MRSRSPKSKCGVYTCAVPELKKEAVLLPSLLKGASQVYPLESTIPHSLFAKACNLIFKLCCIGRKDGVLPFQPKSISISTRALLPIYAIVPSVRTATTALLGKPTMAKPARHSAPRLPQAHFCRKCSLTASSLSACTPAT